MTGLAPWADAHGKQRVTAVLSSVEASDPQPLVACVSPPLGNTWRLGHRSGGTYALAHLVAVRTAGDRCAMNCLTRPTIPHASLEKHKRQRQKPLPFMLVEATGFEPTTSWSRTKRATKLRYASNSEYYIKPNALLQAILSRCSKNPARWSGGVISKRSETGL